jgi:hypothetical protein
MKYVSSPFVPCLFDVESILNVISNNESSHLIFISFYLNDFPSYFHNYPLHAKAFTKVVDSTSTPSHYSRSLDYDHCIMTLVDVEVKEYIEERKEKEKIMLVYDTGMNLSPLSKSLTRRAVL